jgi:hypothetical protein
LSVGWFGAVVAYLALAIIGLTSTDVEIVRAVYLSMDIIARFVIVPFSLATLLAGLVESLGTPWGLFRHWWVLLKFLLTTGATIVLLGHIEAITRMSALAVNTTLSVTDFRAQRIQLVIHAAGGLVVLFSAILLSVYKPWGMTPFGLRNRRERPVSPHEVASTPEPDLNVSQGFGTQIPRWIYVVGFHAAGLLLLFLIVHLTGVGHVSH